MKPTPIELEMPMGKDINGAEHREPWNAYDIDEVDSILAEKDEEIARLKADYSAKVEELCIEKTNVDSLEQAWKQSQRALWLMRAYFCGRSSEYFSGMASRCKIGQEDFYKEVSEKAQRYLKASYKCQAMVKKLR